MYLAVDRPSSRVDYVGRRISTRQIILGSARPPIARVTARQEGLRSQLSRSHARTTARGTCGTFSPLCETHGAVDFRDFTSEPFLCVYKTSQTGRRAAESEHRGWFFFTVDRRRGCPKKRFSDDEDALDPSRTVVLSSEHPQTILDGLANCTVAPTFHGRRLEGGGGGPPPKTGTRSLAQDRCRPG